MANLSLEEMTAQYADLFKELGNIGAGNATSALSQMLDLKLDMSVPEVRLPEFKNVGEAMGGADQIMVGIYLMVEGDIDGSMIFLLSEPSARHLVNIMMQTPDATGEGFNEIELSALKEVGNIITGAYLNSLSMMTNLAIVPSVPYIAVDMLGAILSVPAIAFGTEADQIFLIDTQFFSDVKLEGYCVMLPDMESFGKILSALGMGDHVIG